jgi:hypothetical protein
VGLSVIGFFLCFFAIWMCFCMWWQLAGWGEERVQDERYTDLIFWSNAMGGLETTEF